MTYQAIYDGNGRLCVQRTEDNGAVTSFCPGSDLWNQYVAQFGAPPATGTPTTPTAPLPQNVQNAIANFHTFKQSTAQQRAAMTTAQIAGLIDNVIDCLNYLNNQIQNS